MNKSIIGISIASIAITIFFSWLIFSSMNTKILTLQNDLESVESSYNILNQRYSNVTRPLYSMENPQYFNGVWILKDNKDKGFWDVLVFHVNHKAVLISNNEYQQYDTYLLAHPPVELNANYDYLVLQIFPSGLTTTFRCNFVDTPGYFATLELSVDSDPKTIYTYEKIFIDVI